MKKHDKLNKQIKRILRSVKATRHLAKGFDYRNPGCAWQIAVAFDTFPTLDADSRWYTHARSKAFKTPEKAVASGVVYWAKKGLL